MLKLRRGTVVGTDPLVVEVGGVERAAWADAALVGEVEKGDEVIVNTEALDLSLGSGGFDVVHVNLTRGLDGRGTGGAHVMKLNYTPIQHSVEPVEPEDGGEGSPRPSSRPPVLVLALHGQLAPAAWAAAERAAGLRVGYVQTGGGALPGALSRDVATLRERGLLCGQVTAGPAYGGEAEAISVVGAMDAAADQLGWDAILAGPGPGIIGSASRLGHGGIAALETAHAALALGLPTLLAPRLSEGDPRPRHSGVSHHTRGVLELLLAAVVVPAPQGAAVLGELEALCGERHEVRAEPVDLEGYAAADLPARTMGRGIAEDGLFFAAALAAGRALAEAAVAKGVT